MMITIFFQNISKLKQYIGISIGKARWFIVDNNHSSIIFTNDQ